MRTTRVFVDLPLREGARIALPEDAANHLVRVLRMQEGDACVLFNGDGRDVPATLRAANKRGVEAELGAPVAVDQESPLRIALVQGIARGEKMDWILQKATELGVASVYPVHSDRSEVSSRAIVRPSGSRIGAVWSFRDASRAGGRVFRMSRLRSRCRRCSPVRCRLHGDFCSIRKRRTRSRPCLRWRVIVCWRWGPRWVVAAGSARVAGRGV